MLIIVGFVATMVVVFSIGYMAEDTGYIRYFALLSLFTAAMTSLVISNSLLGIFIGWELVGACSYLLIGFWFEQPAARDASIKAFLVTKLGDLGFFIGLALLWTVTGALTLEAITLAIPGMAPAVVTAAALLLFAGAAGKSAQFPLHVWLPDAMAGPTPVSALIHAATMVAAGVYLVARIWPLFAAAPVARTTILVLAIITALGAALAALPQRDIKKVLAYSTVSQLGFMFAALGVGAWPVAMFHLTTHAAFKALLFLGSGSVIHATETQDLHEMGGLARKMPVTAVTWIVGAAALAGVPPLAGFFSKDEILTAVLKDAPVAGWLLLLAALLTAVYITRATWLAFFGDARGEHHAHESGPAMAIPLVLLAIAAAGLGFAGAPVMKLLGVEPEALAIPIAITSAVIALVGIAIGWVVWRRGPQADASAESLQPDMWAQMCAAFNVDAVYLGLAGGAVAMARYLARVVDNDFIDGAAEGLGVASQRVGRWLTGLQSGDPQQYVMYGAAALIVLIAAALWWRL